MATFSGMTSPRSLDMLRRRCSIRAFNEDRPISAYAFIVLKYLLYGCSTRLCDRRCSFAVAAAPAGDGDGETATTAAGTGYGCGHCGGGSLRGRVL